MTDLNHKYKDRDPMETVNIINTFFISKGLRIDLVKNVKTDADTFWCHLELKTNDNETILTSNGKGATLEYSLASGHAELYERYCSGFQTNKKELFEEYKNNFIKNNFYFSKDEKFLSFDEI